MLTKIASLFENPWGEDNTQKKKPANNVNKDQATQDLELLYKKYKGSFDKFNPNFNSFKGIILGFLAFVVLWLLTGFYTVGPDEQGLVLRFGKYNRTVSPGLHYHLPAPVEKKIKVKVTKINLIEVGYRSIGNNIQSRTEESLMLTGDENIVDINFEVQWRVKDAYNYLFNVRDAFSGNTVRSAAESSMRAVIGKTNIAVALAEGRSQIEEESKMLLQNVLDSYEAGVDIVRLQLLKVDPPSQVIDAFRDVQTAKLDKEKSINQAESYKNDIIPKARGDAQKNIEEALAYKNAKIADATGKSKRFLQVYKEYSRAKDITRKRLYIDTMTEVLDKANVTIIDGSVSKTGVMPYLPINELNKVRK